METVRLYARLNRSGGTISECRLRIDTSYSAGGSTTSDSYVIIDCGTIDISGFSNDTSYEIAVQLRKGDGGAGNAHMYGFAVFLE
jgi:hypothetical protein